MYQPGGADGGVFYRKVPALKVGESWLVLVCPYDPESVPGRHLARNGEGFFLISFGFSNIIKQLERLEAKGVQPGDREPRNGIRNWHIADIGEFNGVLLQMTDDATADPGS